MLDLEKKIEFDKIKNFISEFAHSNVAKKQILEITKIADKEEIEENLSLCNEIQNWIRKEKRFAFFKLKNLKKLFEIPCLYFSLEEIKKIISSIFCLNELLSYWKEVEDFDKQDYPLLEKKIEQLINLDEIIFQYKKIFSPEGEILDNSSLRLHKIRKNFQATKLKINKELESSFADLDNSIYDKLIFQREGRYVIAVKNSAKNMGISYGKSNSGASYFVEPYSVVEKNNYLLNLKEEEKEEIKKILSDFSKLILENKESILLNFKVLTFLDKEFAKAEFCNYIHGNKPKITEDALLNLKNAYHPLLLIKNQNKKIVPFDLNLNKDKPILIISGPNTGGKTVVLKAICLISYMTSCGICPPVSPTSEIGIFSSFFIDIKDEQSIEKSLSSFSSHLLNLNNIIENSDSQSIIALDEILTSTDPEQGIALSKAIIEELNQKKTLTVITTHYTALKMFAYQNYFCQNAHMEFDAENNLPTYKFIVGSPGSSFAIETAENLGMKSQIIQRAKHYTDNSNLIFSNLLKQLQEERNKYSLAVSDLNLKNKLMEEKLKEMQIKKNSLEKENKEKILIEKQKLQNKYIEIQKEINKEMQEIKEKDKKFQKEILKKNFSKINFALKNLEENGKEKVINPQVNQIVWIESFKETGKILEIISENKIKISLNEMEIITDIDNLFMSNSSDKKIDRILNKAKVIKNSDAKYELNLNGKNYQEAIILLDEFFDKAILAGYSFLRIIHGKSFLKEKILSYLKENKIEFLPASRLEGGEGASIIKI